MRVTVKWYRSTDTWFDSQYYDLDADPPKGGLCFKLLWVFVGVAWRRLPRVLAEVLEAARKERGKQVV